MTTMTSDEISNALIDTNGNQTAAARKLGVDRYKIRLALEKLPDLRQLVDSLSPTPLSDDQIEALLHKHKGNQRAASEELGFSQSYVNQRVKKSDQLQSVVDKYCSEIVPGNRFGAWKVICREGSTKNKSATWRVECQNILPEGMVCQNQAVIPSGNLRSKDSTQCRACSTRKAKTKHGATRNRKKEPEYSVWKSMRSRCYRVSDKSYPYYGGRGISIDPSWDDYESFINDMGKRPSSKHTVERVDPNGSYSKENCKWILRKEQSLNTRKSYRDLAGNVVNHSQLKRDEISISPCSLKTVLKAGWTEQDIREFWPSLTQTQKVFLGRQLRKGRKLTPAVLQKECPKKESNYRSKSYWRNTYNPHSAGWRKIL